MALFRGSSLRPRTLQETKKPPEGRLHMSIQKKRSAECGGLVVPSNGPSKSLADPVSREKHPEQRKHIDRRFGDGNTLPFGPAVQDFVGVSKEELPRDPAVIRRVVNHQHLTRGGGR